jgi:N-acetyl-gamma-glutamyl-phosphate reductase
MTPLNVAVVGASGYSGLELLQLLSRHPNVRIQVCTSDKFAGTSVASKAIFRGAHPLTFVRNEGAEHAAQDCEVVFLATPHEASLDLLPRFAKAGRTVIDLSGAFRFKDANVFERAYALKSAKLAAATPAPVYGLPELFRESLRGAEIIANPGCFPTATILPIAPLLAHCEARGIIVDAASGVTGAGRKATEAYSFSEIESDYRAYKVLSHQHEPEICEQLSRYSSSQVNLTFTAHLLPLRRGILATCYLWRKPGVQMSDMRAALATAYSNEPFVELAASANDVSLRRVVGTNRICIGVSGDDSDSTRPVVVIAAIDNLVKGAAGQALQNMNIARNFPEATGLDDLRGFSP